jgi:hypothetical protein
MVETIVLVAIIVVILAATWWTRGRGGPTDAELRALDIESHITHMGDPVPGPDAQFDEPREDLTS